MSSRGKHDVCRMCGGSLQGNQRRWLFGGQLKKTDQGQTPTGSLRGGSSLSSTGSPWGSSTSLGSSVSLSQFGQGSPAKALDVLSVLTHILGRPVTRGGGHGEFLCGKCVCVLERVFKFDSVLARVRALSSERLQKLTGERDKIRQWVRQSYDHRYPGGAGPREDGGEAEKEGYREMLRDNMALSEYECWSERWDGCPYFVRTGRRCRGGIGCDGCDSLRVSDSDYESVCGVPRRLPAALFSPTPLALSRDKSQSMPLDWQRAASPGSGSASSLAGGRVHSGSTLSLQTSSRTASVRSLDSLDADELFGAAPGVRSAVYLLKAIGGTPLSSPAGSRIPVLERRHSGGGGGAAPSVSRALRLGSEENGGEGPEEEEEEEEEEEGLRDEFMPLHRQVCMGLIRKLSVEEATGAELMDKLTETLKETQSDNQAALQTLRSEVTEKEKSMEEEVEALRKAGRDREGDLDTLNAVLQCNQDVLHDLREALEERERLLKEVEKEREVWKQRDCALATVLQEKDALIQDLANCHKDVEGLAADTEGNGATLCREVTKLTTALQEYQAMVQAQQAGHSHTVSSLKEQLRDTRRELRAKEKEKKEADRARQNHREDGERQERKLRDGLQKRDQLIEQILLDAEERDHQLRELQQNLQNQREPLSAIKHTL
ncbi:hypothetical protein EYF80_050476 [Liparis tanakae]|uniref:Short myomegalin-like EB1 binding protein N-terminal domain-containing protein n=1 Tax=Liparis tanakae TaxID=230148 RepID=A0A4Z2FEN2_9TELE|nr:hypothetical protein EYF80_050476 [Liparis tanakae]